MENIEKEVTNNLDKKVEARKSKIKSWLKDPYNLVFIGILIVTLVVRFYYFWITKDQPIWWDESEYMSAAKGYAGIVDYTLPNIRLPLFSLLISILFRIGITSEPILRFFVAFIPSLAVIFIFYFVVREMYPDKRIAILSTIILSVLWEHLFYSNRFHTENPALLFEFLALFILFFCYIKKKDFWIVKSKYSLIWVLLLSIIAILFRPGNIMFFPAVFLFIILLNKSFLLTKKGIILSLAFISLVLISGFLFFNIAKPFIFMYYQPNIPVSFSSLNVFYGFYQSYNWIPSIFFYTFILGIVILIFDLFVNWPKLKSIVPDDSSLELKSDILNILLILSLLFVFIFMMRVTQYEFRWFFAFLPGMLVFTVKGAIKFSEFIGSFFKIKHLSIIILVFLFIGGVYTQWYHADMIIKDKITSYQQVKESGLWMKENSNPSDVIISESQPQHIYYSERKIVAFPTNETDMLGEIKKLHPKYLVVSVFEPGFTPKWVYDWPQRNNQTVQPIRAYYLDSEQKQVALVIYEVKNS